jgi:hypothetical protein
VNVSERVQVVAACAWMALLAIFLILVSVDPVPSNDHGLLGDVAGLAVSLVLLSGAVLATCIILGEVRLVAGTRDHAD